MVNVTLKELITRTSWAKIEEKMLAIYPEEADSLHHFKRLYWSLANLEADQNPAGAMIQFELFSDDEVEQYFDDSYDEYDDYDDFYEEEFTMTLDKWKKILGYFIPNEILKEIDGAEAVVHAFVEAAYGGLREVEVEIENDVEVVTFLKPEKED